MKRHAIQRLWKAVTSLWRALSMCFGIIFFCFKEKEKEDEQKAEAESRSRKTMKNLWKALKMFFGNFSSQVYVYISEMVNDILFWLYLFSEFVIPVLT